MNHQLVLSYSPSGNVFFSLFFFGDKNLNEISKDYRINQDTRWTIIVDPNQQKNKYNDNQGEGDDKKVLTNRKMHKELSTREAHEYGETKQNINPWYIKLKNIPKVIQNPSQSTCNQSILLVTGRVKRNTNSSSLFF